MEHGLFATAVLLRCECVEDLISCVVVVVVVVILVAYRICARSCFVCSIVYDEKRKSIEE
jgi:hypothetical protein